MRIQKHVYIIYVAIGLAACGSGETGGKTDIEQVVLQVPEAAALIAEARAKEISGGFSDIEECQNVATQIEESLSNPRERPYDLPNLTLEEELQQARNLMDFCKAGSIYTRIEL